MECYATLASAAKLQGLDSSAQDANEMEFRPIDPSDAASLQAGDHRSFNKMAAANPERAARCVDLLTSWGATLRARCAAAPQAPCPGIAEELTSWIERRVALTAAQEFAQVRRYCFFAAGGLMC